MNPREGFVSAQANLLCKSSVAAEAKAKRRTRQAIRGISDMFRKDGLL